MRVTLPGDVVQRYRRFSLYNSPYPAHDHGNAIDLYPESNDAISPVAGVVRDTRTVGCPGRPYASSEDHLIVIDVDQEWAAAAGVDADVDADVGEGLLARILHVDPSVEPGDRVDVGDSLGPMVRSGFFGQWVANHVHLGFRPTDANPYRASGSLPIDVDVAVAPMAWDGTGQVVETGPSHVVLDAPEHPAPEETFAAIASDSGIPLDGGLAHYAGGGLFGHQEGPIDLLGQQVGVAAGRDVTWDPVQVLVGEEHADGLSLFAARDAGFGAKVVRPEADLRIGDEVAVRIVPSDDPVRLGAGR